MPFFFALLLAMVVPFAVAAQDGYAMPDRVYCDVDAGISFRCPYEWTMPDQYVGAFLPAGTKKTVVVKGEPREIETWVTGPDGKPKPILSHVGSWRDALPDGLNDQSTLGEIGNTLVGGDLVWTELDYYRADPQRPFAVPTWALPGIEVREGAGKEVRCLLIATPERVDLLIADGTRDQAAMDRVFASVEVLATGLRTKAKPGKEAKAARPAKSARTKGPARMTWRDAQVRKGMVFTGGRSVKPAKTNTGVPWSDCWEIETEHYHITGNKDPQLLLQRGLLFEALYRAYAKIYEPAAMPPVKFEVHCFDTADQYEEAVRVWFDPDFVVQRPGSINGGFFVPHLLSLWLYEQSGELGGESMALEHVGAHECSHQFLHMACNGSRHVPTWFNEGLAVYFENGVFRGNEYVLRSPDRIDELKAQYARRGRTLVPLSEYLDHHGPIAADQYAEVYAMVQFWVFGTCEPDPESCNHKRCGLKRFREYWQALKKGENGTQAFERIFLVDLERIHGSREAALAVWELSLIHI
jgi:hypothetical protein